MMRAFFFAMLVMVGLTGCDSVRDISRDPRYATLVGREVKTTVPMWLYDFNTPTAPQHPSVLTKNDSGDHRKVGQLSVGHKVRFDQVKRTRNGTSVDEHLVGVTLFKGRTYNIEYHTGAYWGEEGWLRLFDCFGVERPPEKTYR